MLTPRRLFVMRALFVDHPKDNTFAEDRRGGDSARQALTIAFGIDNAFALPLAAALHSLLDGLSGDESPHIYIVSTASRGISRANKDRLHRVVADRAILHWPMLTRLPADAPGLATSEHLSLATHYRIFLPEVLPPACRKILYLDADVIVQGDIRALWETHMEEHVIRAVRDPAIFNVASPKGLLKYRELGMPPDTPYFNGGVLLVDVEKWRRAQITQQFLDYSAQYGIYSQWGDQDGLNAILHHQWGALDERWNLQTFVVDGRTLRTPREQERYVTTIRDRLGYLTTGSFIIHYTEGRKPWHPWCKHPFRSLFHDHFLQSGCFPTRMHYLVWYAYRYLSWFYKKLTIRRTWKILWKRIRNKTYARLLRPAQL